MQASGNGMAAPGHGHVFLGSDHERNERRVWTVIALTAAMMVAEIVAGYWFGSMALTADGWHMFTHAGAMLISALAYLYARREAQNPRFSFGTGKFGDLAGFASAVVLAAVALMIAWESALRLIAPVSIDFDQAIFVAVIGLAVNLASAWLLRDDHGHHDHGHAHTPTHDHDHGSENRAVHGDSSHRHHGDHGGHHGGHTGYHAGQGARDNNLRAVYLHVMADALTSVLAIAALLLGKFNGWTALDPLIGIAGGLVIAHWSWGLMRTAGAVLVDCVPQSFQTRDLPATIRAAVETPQDRVLDLHVWQIGPGHCAAIVALASTAPQNPDFYRKKLGAIRTLSHITVEVSAAN